MKMWLKLVALGVWREEVAGVESRMRAKFTDTHLPPPVLKYVPPTAKAKAKSAACSQSGSIVDESPALTFDSHGNVETNFACKARMAGFAVGSSCCTSRLEQGIKRGRTGTVISIGDATLEVAFSAGGEKGPEAATILCSLDALKQYEPPQAVPNKRQRLDDAALNLPQEIKGIPWKAYDSAGIKESVRRHMATFAEQIRIQQSPLYEEVAILEDQSIMVAKKELPPLTLKIFPTTHDLQVAAKGDAVDVTVRIPQVAETLKLKTVGPKDNFGRIIGTSLIIDPLEYIAASSKKARQYDGGCVELKRVMSGTVTVPWSEYTSSDLSLRPSKKARNIRLESHFSYWTNQKKVPMGSALALTRTTGR